MNRWLAAALVVVAPVGCHARGGEGTNPTSDDAGPPGIDASTIADASVEAGVADAGLDDATNSSDAAREASAADASHWCDSQEFIFCDDFDEYALAQGWDGTDSQRALITLDNAACVTEPYAFVATTEGVGAGQVALGRLQKKITDQVSSIQFAFDLRPEELDPTNAGATVATIELATAAGTAIDSVNLVVGTGLANVEDFGASEEGGSAFAASYPLMSGVPSGTWTHVAIDVELLSDAGIGGGTVTVYLNDAAAPALDHAAMSPESQPALPFLFLGAGVQGPSSPVKLRMDDVTLNYL